jgi:peptidoglycan/xylan/chitin deacetylase (PgdA/CDA1 family)
MGESRRRELRYAPRLIYPPRRLYSHARSLRWKLRDDTIDNSGGLRILFYHRVSDENDLLAVPVARFEEQMAFAHEAGIRLLDLEAAFAAWSNGEDSSRVCALTFDDGYADVLQNAVPVLERHGFSATMFVAGGAIDGSVQFSWYDGRQPPLLSWDQIRQLNASGTMRFGAHTVTHPNLVALDNESAKREIVDSKRDLERQIDREVQSFAYPGGLFSAREVELTRESGIPLAVTCEPGLNQRGCDPLMLRRTQIDRGDGLIDFKAKLGGGHDRPLPLRGLFRRFRYGVE